MMGSVLQVELHYDDEAYPLEYIAEEVSDEKIYEVIRRWAPFQEEPEHQNISEPSNLDDSTQPFQFPVDFMIVLLVMLILITMAACKNI